MDPRPPASARPGTGVCEGSRFPTSVRTASAFDPAVYERAAKGARLNRLGVLVLTSISLLGPGPVPLGAQEGAFAFEIRGGAAVPISSFRSGDEGWAGEIRGGPSFGMGFTFPAPGPFGLFLGFGQRRFECAGDGCRKGSTWESTGFDVALRLVVGSRRIRPWVRGGLHTHRVEGQGVEGDGAAIELKSEGGAGYEFGGGLLIAIGERTSVSPGFHYGSGSAPFPDRPDLRLAYFVADLGLVLGF